MELPQKVSPASSPTLRVSIPISDLTAVALVRRRFSHRSQLFGVGGSTTLANRCEGDVTAEAIHCEADSGFFAKIKKDCNF